MADNTLDVSPPFKFEIKSPPRGMLDYDPSAITASQQQQLNSYKIDLMKENMFYLGKHPEVRAIYSWTVDYLWKVKPKEVLGQLGDRFSIPEPKIRKEIERIITEEMCWSELEECKIEDWDY